MTPPTLEEESQRAMEHGLAALTYEMNYNARKKGFYDAHHTIMDILAEHDKTHHTKFLNSYYTTWQLARLMLITTEVAEAAEAVRKTDGGNLGEELADILIRLGDFSVDQGTDIGRDTMAKMRKNAERPQMHGKLA